VALGRLGELEHYGERHPWGCAVGSSTRASTERIDGIVALIMAIGRAMVAQEEPEPEYSMFFV
jgi:hypothetical protein